MRKKKKNRNPDILQKSDTPMINVSVTPRSAALLDAPGASDLASRTQSRTLKRTESGEPGSAEDTSSITSLTRADVHLRRRGAQDMCVETTAVHQVLQLLRFTTPGTDP